MENVTQVHGTKNKEHFDKWIEFLASKGYSNYWQDLNAKDFGIPQNRNRCFMVSILGDYAFTFPTAIPLTIRLSDMLEDTVDEKFYLSADYIDYAKRLTAESESNGNGFRFAPFERERANSQDHHKQSRTESNRQFCTGVQVSNQGKVIGNTTDICSTLMARDYKGFNNYGMTGVLEIESDS